MNRTAALRIAAVAGAVTLGGMPAAAHARGGDDDRGEVRVAGTCGSGASSRLKLKRDDGAIEVEFEVDRNRAGERWRVVLVQDGRVVRRLTARTGGRSGSFSVERRLRDLQGADRITARASGPAGRSCTASAVLTA